jgi:dTDP-4-dehydrorhamnose reductase
VRILLTGRNGQVGWELERTLQSHGTVIATDRTTMDLADDDAIRRVVREARPQIIVNAAAYTAVDKAESEQDLAMRINGVAPGIMAEEAKRLGALLVHYSTDYVFDGSKRSPYTEDDAPNPLSTYGRTKLEGENRIRDSGCRHLILRTSWVYGPRASNFYRIIERKALASEAMRMVDDQTSVPTPAQFLARYTVRLVSEAASGVLNLVPCGMASRYEFALEVVRLLDSSSKVEPARTVDFPSPARRPPYSVLDNRRAQCLLAAAFPDWPSVLADMRQSPEFHRRKH